MAYQTQGKTEIAPGVEFNVLDREWRCKWTDADDNQSLKDCLKLLEKTQNSLFTLTGDWTSNQLRSKDVMNGNFDVEKKGVQRIVDFETKDFKVILKLPMQEFQD